MTNEETTEEPKVNTKFIQEKYDTNYTNLEIIREELKEVKKIIKASVDKLKNTESRTSLEALSAQTDNYIKVLKTSMDVEKQIVDSVTKNINALKSSPDNKSQDSLFDPVKMLLDVTGQEEA